MKAKLDEVLFADIKNIEREVKKIVDSLKLDEFAFEIKLILSEAIANAFEHGNKKDVTKPIYIRYMKDSDILTLEVQDSGDGFKNIVIPNVIEDENIMSERGRGLYLINCFSDEVTFKGNTIIMKKRISGLRAPHA